MKIIDLGADAPQNKWPRRFICRKCKSVLETMPVDISGFYDQRDGDTGMFDCPVCGERNYISVKNWEDAKTAIRMHTTIEENSNG